MNSQNGQICDFRMMCDDAAKDWILTARRAANKVNEKSSESYRIFCQNNSAAEKSFEDFIEKTKSFDSVIEKYLRLKANSLSRQFRKASEIVVNWYYKTFHPVEEYVVSIRSELLKSNPFSKEFKEFDSKIEDCQKKLNELQSKLESLISKEGLKKIEVIRKRAEAILSDVLNPEQDPFGVYFLLYTTGTGRIRFQKEKLEKVEHDNHHRCLGTIIKLCNTKKGEEIPFAVISANKKDNRTLRKKYGDIVISEYNSDEFFQDLILMLNSLISNIKIELLEERTFSCELSFTVDD